MIHWLTSAAIFLHPCSMFLIDVDDLYFDFNARTSVPNPIIIYHLISFWKVGGIPNDTQWYSCFLYLSHIDCNVGPFKNIGALRFEHTRSSEYHSHSSDFSELMCSCHLNWASHVYYFIDFIAKSLFLFIVESIWHTYPPGFTLFYSMIQKWDVTFVMCKYYGRIVIFPADI